MGAPSCVGLTIQPTVVLMPHWVAVSLAFELMRMCFGMGLAMWLLAPRDNEDDSPGVLPRPVDPRAQMQLFMLCVVIPEYILLQMLAIYVACLARRK